MVGTREARIALVVVVLVFGVLPALAAASSWHGGWGHGAGRWREARQAGWCAAKADTYAGERMALIEMHLALRPEQQDAWARLAEAAGRSGLQLKTLCSAAAVGTPEVMARLEARIESSLEAIRALRPPLETLYAQLDPAQRSRLDGLLKGRL